MTEYNSSLQSGKDQKETPAPSREYDEQWIRDTWGWDTPEHFIETQGRNLRPRILEGMRIAALKPGMRILDIGCGRGEVVLHCAREGMYAVGIDYSEDVLKIAEKAKETHTTEEQARMQFLCEDVKKVHFDDKFDRITLFDVVEHLHDWELAELFDCCHKLLKPDGCILIHTLPNKWIYEITYKRIIRLFMPWLPANPRSEKEMAIHINEMTITHLSAVLRKAGYQARVWLQDLIVEQARWHAKQPLADRRGRLYRWLANPILGGFYKLIAKTPVRLLIVNEMFALAWKHDQPSPVKTPLALTEKIAIALSRSGKKHNS